MSIPPEYQQTHRELQAIIDNPPKLSDVEQTNTIDNLTSDVSTPDAEKTLKELQVLREAEDADLPVAHLFPMVSVYDASARSGSDAYAADSLVGIGPQEEAQMLA